MDRNREARRAAAASTLVTTSNGITLSRRRHRSSTTLRDPTDEDGGVELQESIRLRDRVKKERDLRERDRDREKDRERDREREREREREIERERERASRSSSKRRRAERLLAHHNNNINNTNSQNNNNNNNNNHTSVDVGLVDDSSEESVNDDEENDNLHDDSNIFSCGGISNQYHNNNFQPLRHRKSFPPNNIKTLRTAPVWKSGDEMIGVSVPRKARSAATKRSHDWLSSNNGAVPVPPPMSPSSSNASTRKKIKLSNGPKLRPPNSSSVAKSTSSNPEELEIEIAEVLYGLMTQTQGPSSKKEIPSNDSKESNNRSNHDSKSRVSSPISGSNTGPPLPQNLTSSATPLSSIAPKRKRPRQVLDNLVSSSARSSPNSSTKVEIDQTLKTDVLTLTSSANLIPGCAAVSYDLGSLANSQQPPPEPMKMDLDKKLLPGQVVDGKIISTEKEEVGCSLKKDTPVLGQDESICEDASTSAAAGTVTDTLIGSVNKGNLSLVEERYREEKFQIDLMALPQSRMSPDTEREVNFAVDDKKQNLSSVEVTTAVASVDKEAVKMIKCGEDEMVNDGGESKKAKINTEHVESKKAVVNKSPNINLQLDLERPGETIVAGNKLQKQVSQKRHQETVEKATTKEEPHDEKPGLSNSLSIPLSMPSWPSGIRPMGYMAPLQGVVSMDGVAVPSAPIQMPMFSQPRPKRCATHCYIARNIHYMQQFMKMNPFWSAAAAASSASLFGSKPGNLSLVPSGGDLHLNTSARPVNHAQENKGQGLAVPLGHGGKEKGSQHLNSSDSPQRNQQILLQQAVPPVAPNNLLGPAFIFPLNQQQAAVAAAAAAVCPASAKSPAIAPGAASSNASNSSAVSSSATGAMPAMSYTYPNMPGNETQYLAILQNNAYPFPIPTVGANPNFRGPHPQPIPFFNGFSYSSQMIHPSQLQQQAVPPSQSQQVQQSHPNAQLSSSSSTHKHLQIQQQTSQGNAINGANGNGKLQQLAAKNRSSQQSRSSTNQHPQVPQFRQLDNQVGGGDGTNTADNRGTRAPMNMYGPNFAMPMHIPNFALISPPATLASGSSASSNQSDKKHHQWQQPGMKSGIESLPPQTFAMSFGPLNGATNPGSDLSSMAQNHAIFQNFTDSSRHNFQMMAAATAGQVGHHKTDDRASEDGKTGGGDPSDCTDDERKGMANKVSTTVGQSIAFSRSELPDGSTIQGSHVVESSSRSLNPASAFSRCSHPSIPNHKASSGVQNAQLQVQLQHQQQHLIQLHKQQHQQQQLTARIKTPVTSNGSAYPDHLASSSTSIAAKFPNALSFPQNIVQNSNSNSSSQSPQWKNPQKTSASQNPSSLSSSTSATLKNIQQPARALQNQTQISFGSNQKSTPASNQASSPPMVIGSPTTSSISKGASGSPRITATSGTSNKTGPAPSMSTQQSRSCPSVPNQKSSPSTSSGRNVPSVLGNPQAAPSPVSGTKSQMHAHQQQQLANNLQQAQLFFSNPYMQNQSLHTSSTNAPTSGNTGYCLQRRRTDQQHSPHQSPGSPAPTSTGILPNTGVGTIDPAKVVAAAAAAGASNMKGGGFPSQSIPNFSQFTEQASRNHPHLMSGGFSYGHTVPAAVQMKVAEQKQPAGNDSLHESWQPEKK